MKFAKIFPAICGCLLFGALGLVSFGCEESDPDCVPNGERCASSSQCCDGGCNNCPDPDNPGICYCAGGGNEV